MRKSLARVWLLLLLLAGAGALAEAQSYRAIDIAAEEEKAERLIVEAIAKERARLAPGVRALAADPALARMARERSREMANGAPFAHEDETGRFAAAEKVKRHFGPYGAIGENILMERDLSRSFEAEAFARRAVRNWMNSETHRQTILSPLYDRSGVGVVFSGGFVFATHLFWGPPSRRGAVRQFHPF